MSYEHRLVEIGAALSSGKPAPEFYDAVGRDADAELTRLRAENEALKKDNDALFKEAYQLALLRDILRAHGCVAKSACVHIPTLVNDFLKALTKERDEALASCAGEMAKMLKVAIGALSEVLVADANISAWGRRKIVEALAQLETLAKGTNDANQ